MIESYVDDCYSVQRFKDTYQFEVNPMDDKSQWPELNPGFDMRPPKLDRSPGRPTKKRIKAAGELGKGGSYQCKRCFQFGHIEKGCRNPRAEPDDDIQQPPPKKKGKRSAAKSSSSPGVVTRSKAQCSTSSPGAVTRSKAQSSTRQRAAGQNGSPTGTKRRLVA